MNDWPRWHAPEDGSRVIRPASWFRRLLCRRGRHHCLHWTHSHPGHTPDQYSENQRRYCCLFCSYEWAEAEPLIAPVLPFSVIYGGTGWTSIPWTPAPSGGQAISM